MLLLVSNMINLLWAKQKLGLFNLLKTELDSLLLY